MVKQFKNNKLLLTLTLAENELFNQTLGNDPSTLHKVKDYDLKNRNKILQTLPKLPNKIMNNTNDPELNPIYEREENSKDDILKQERERKQAQKRLDQLAGEIINSPT